MPEQILLCMALLGLCVQVQISEHSVAVTDHIALLRRNLMQAYIDELLELKTTFEMLQSEHVPAAAHMPSMLSATLASSSSSSLSPAGMHVELHIEENQAPHRLSELKVRPAYVIAVALPGGCRKEAVCVRLEEPCCHMFTGHAISTGMTHFALERNKTNYAWLLPYVRRLCLPSIVDLPWFNQQLMCTGA